MNWTATDFLIGAVTALAVIEFVQVRYSHRLRRDASLLLDMLHGLRKANGKDDPAPDRSNDHVHQP